MRKYVDKIYNLARSRTALDTYILFASNVTAAFLGFVFTWVVARKLSIAEFGVLSAATNLIVMITSLTDLGVSSGIINFVSQSHAEKNYEESDKYSKASLIVKLSSTIFISLLLLIFRNYITNSWLATKNLEILYWVISISVIGIIWGIAPYILQARKEFLKSSLIDVVLSFAKAVLPFIFLYFGLLTLRTSMISFIFGMIVSAIVGLALVGTSFLRSRPGKEIYVNLMRYAGWIGVNRVISSISGKVEVQMLAAMAGAVTTGLYSVPIKLASFIGVLAASFSSVLAPRFASFNNREAEKNYMLKSCLALIPIVAGLVFWIIIAKPFVLLLFGQKYIDSVVVLRALIFSMIPFIMNVPAVTAIIYSLKKTEYIGYFSIFQIICTISLNLIFIPKFGALGPTFTFTIVNTILLIYSWTIAIKYYWFEKNI